MSSLTGSGDSWHPEVTANTTISSYWLNWRVLICTISVLITMTFSLLLICKHEGFRKSNQVNGEAQQKTAGFLYENETWTPCLKGVHPGWLLAFRVLAFIVLLICLFVIDLVDGGSIFYFYTQWTFTLITIYFGLGSLLSMYGCYQYHKWVSGDKVDNVEVDAERGTSNNTAKDSHNLEIYPPSKPAGIWGYTFQILFQMNAGAVLLTDFVFWFIIAPFLEKKDYGLNFLTVNMHSINAVFLLGDTVFNCLRFPYFRIAYFFLWTVAYVIFQWILHACVHIWWPYPFLDLSSSLAPLWYLAVALMHFPCYGVFALVIKLKHHLLSRWFGNSYWCTR
ncbi:hypothetical protein SLEP1_g44566 [Rubroshorea leprosula]|uniref:Uncharacterized protein n=1 Tax=Rubroshorea leprosula TaxID=152421 RepID=A0AAV5LHV1_9ROSI|nr:hypothetical protein SLEP1_g44566 [Rubroshorea leprosula]